mmetsp:Transcript_17970/g.36864  ORF Transcript_17970/g.36864 Transcript_17970/m.36864 type:complete len:338 (-) Transcript_17970:204-1217(-)|eukprot:CAMPEP_0201126582 /NCGR_PEP_ID=MMETSP0850-20130426/26706_1 /ASSEMBLY_ACC=CAM_ASM_000622 /TAXON_ID=183588 /ORGANISM="Pseudo-nitzschia fraudulenta, Strain WWA7" /LENGTH=337 /DNA_ID=CAMNT_0047395073 /DNA_START=442 /DNA_END=1455 /DNA_ORIENTATION=+
MSTETGAEKRRLSRSSSEIEEDATKTAAERNSTNSEDSDTTKQLDEKQKRREQHADQMDEKNDVRNTSRTNNEVEVGTMMAPMNKTNDVIPGDGSRQIIAVSANKNPTAFFQLARKFLMTNEMCDLSALEGAIVSAVDAAHLLERSKLASIVRIHTSYVNVEPKRRRQVSQQKGDASSSMTTELTSSTAATGDGFNSSKPKLSPVSNVTSAVNTVQIVPASVSSAPDSKTKTEGGSGDKEQGGRQSSTASITKTSVTSISGSGNRELRRARILVTVKRTESYKQWLEENPIQRQAIIAGTATVTADDIAGGALSSSSDNTDFTPNVEPKSKSFLSKK